MRPLRPDHGMHKDETAAGAFLPRGGFVYSISLRKPSPSTSCASLMKRNASSSASRTMALEPSHLLRAQDAQQHRAFLSAVAALGAEHRYPRSSFCIISCFTRSCWVEMM